MTLHFSSEVTFGMIRLLVNRQPADLLKCPFCSFRNIHEDEITHHIMYKDDSNHDIDVEHLDKKNYIVSSARKESLYGPYISKDDLPLPSIRCLWCEYEDKVERDLEYHFLQNHKKRLYQMKAPLYERKKVWSHDPFSWMYSDIEYRLYKAVKLAKLKCGIGIQK